MKKIVSFLLSIAILAGSCMPGSIVWAEESSEEPFATKQVSEPEVYANTTEQITDASVNQVEVDPSAGVKLICNFTLTSAATCSVQVWSTTSFVGYAANNQSFSAGSNSVTWSVPQNLADGKYSFRIVSLQNGKEVDRWVDFTVKNTPFSISAGSASASTIDPAKDSKLSCTFTLSKAATCSVQVWSTTSFVGYVANNQSFSAGSNSVTWSVPQNLADGKYSFRIVSLQNGKEVDRWVDFTVKSSTLSISNTSTSVSSVNASTAGNKISLSFKISQAANCSVEMWSSSKFLGYAVQNQNYAAGSYNVSWTVPQYLAQGKYSFRIVATKDGKTIDKWVDFQVTGSYSPYLQGTYFTLAQSETRQLYTVVKTTSSIWSEAVSWSSSNNAVASVSGGMVTAKAVGTANITAVDKYGNAATCRIDVVSAGKHRMVDLSYANSNINFAQLKASGVDYVMLRACYSYPGSTESDSKYIDSNFDKYINEATAAGLKVGVYHFSYALNAEEADKEADFLIRILDKYKDKITLPVAYDLEYNSYWTNNGLHPSAMGNAKFKETMTEFARRYLAKIRAAGYKPMIYASSSFYNSFIDAGAVGAHDKWIAHYDVLAPSVSGADMWQYSSEGTPAGAPYTVDSGRVDMNIVYKDY